MGTSLSIASAAPISRASGYFAVAGRVRFAVVLLAAALLVAFVVLAGAAFLVVFAVVAFGAAFLAGALAGAGLIATSTEVPARLAPFAAARRPRSITRSPRAMRPLYAW